MMVMQARVREQTQLEMQRRMQLEAQIWQGMTEEQRDRMREQQRMTMMMMMAEQQGQLRAEHIRMAGNSAEGSMPRFPRGPLFFLGQMGGLAADPRTRPPTGSDPNEASPRASRAGVRNGRPGVVYGDWEVEDLSDDK